MSWYLQPSGGLDTNGAPTTPELRTYIYDPKAPTPSVGGNNLFLESGPMDQRAIGDRQDVLKFVSEPLGDPIEIVGSLGADLWVSTSAEDTDFIVKLVDIYPDGYEALIQDQGLRLRHREGLERQIKAAPDQLYNIRVDLWSTALVINKGHRIGVFIQSSNAPRFEPHPNTLEPVASYDASIESANTIHMGPTCPSRILLPVTRIYRTGSAAGLGTDERSAGG